MIKCYRFDYETYKVEIILDDMREQGIPVDVDVYNAIFANIGLRGDSGACLKFYYLMKEQDIEMDHISFGHFITCLFKDPYIPGKTKVDFYTPWGEEPDRTREAWAIADQKRREQERMALVELVDRLRSEAVEHLLVDTESFNQTFDSLRKIGATEEMMTYYERMRDQSQTRFRDLLYSHQILA